MTSLALTDCEPMLTAVAGQRIPRRAWADVAEMTGLVNEAGRILQTAKGQAEFLQRRAYFDGRAAGASQAHAEAIRHVLEAQKQARDLIDAAESRIVDLAVAIVARIVPKLEQAQLVAMLAAEGLSAILEERHICVRVNGVAEQATLAMLDRWQLAHPEVETLRVMVDPQLDPLACVIESELGRIEVGLSAQLEAVHARLAAVAAQSAP